MSLTNLDEHERMAKKQSKLKKSGNDADKDQLAGSVIDSISLPSFSFPLKKGAVSSNGMTPYVYENNATFRSLRHSW